MDIGQAPDVLPLSPLTWAVSQPPLSALPQQPTGFSEFTGRRGLLAWELFAHAMERTVCSQAAMVGLHDAMTYGSFSEHLHLL